MKSVKYIVNPQIEDYLEKLFPPDEGVIGEMQRKAYETGMPIIGRMVGNYLCQLAIISNSVKFFEMGSGFGYSALWFAKAAGETGRIVCTDYSAENRQMALDYFKRARLKTDIEFLVGDSLELLGQSSEKYDIIFNDIDKEGYPDVIDTAYEKLEPGGLLITDNVLWHGRVAGDDDLPSTYGVKRYNELILMKEGFYTTIIPIRDGLSVSIKTD